MAISLTEKQWAHICLSETPGIGGVKFNRLIRSIPLEKISSAGVEELMFAGVSESEALEITRFSEEFDRAKYTECMNQHQIFPLFQGEEGYSESLGKLGAKPPVIWVHGVIKNVEKQTKIAVVGSRRTLHGTGEVVSKIVQDLVPADVVIVSGLAEGVDSMAHFAAMRSGGHTIGVLGAGIAYSKIYNTSKQFLKLWESQVVLSGFSLFCPAAKGTFPRRNEIMAGISDAVIVIQAGQNSGSLITAKCAKKQGKKVYIVPGDVLSWGYVGSHDALKSGLGEIATSASDVCEGIQQSVSSSKRLSEKGMCNLSSQEQQLLGLIRKGVSSLEDLANETKQSGSCLLKTLSLLELRGLVRNCGGRYIC